MTHIVDTPRAGDKITEKGIPTTQFQALLESLELAVNLNTPLTGTGSPEGVVTAEPYQLYLDTTGGAGSIAYRKMTGSGNTGWIAV
jgi:hypothetical protein